MKFIPHRNKDNTMLLNVMYHSRRDTEGGPDCVEIVTKDLDTGKKEVYSIDNPEYDFWIPKEEYRDKKIAMPIMPLEYVEQHTCKYSNMTNYIGKTIGGDLQEYIKSCRANGNYKGLREIPLHPDLYAVDLPYETFVRSQWLLHNHNDRVKPITKGFFDIETDNKIPMKFTDDGSVPINAISYVDNESKNAFLFLLRHPDNPQIAEFETRVNEFIAELHFLLDERYPGLKYHVRMYDNEKELDMMADFFRYINMTKPDMVGGWNAGSFDYPVILRRIATLGGDARDIICHPDFRIKRVQYTPDRRSSIKPEQRADVFRASSYTTYMDSMTAYAGFRKSKGVINSLKLTDVAKKEIGDEKLDYGEAEDMNTFAWDDYWRFALYAMKD